MVIMGRQRLKIGTNFITDIPSGRGSIGPNNAEINVTVLHQVATRVVGDQGVRNTVSPVQMP